ncbi:unnamed protein product [Closterium sp. NIES-64]|nr:unnamed protein product [Closterium sp. NIES-64]
MGQALGSTQQWQYDQLELVYELDGLRTSYIRKFFQDYRFDILAPARVIVIKAFNIDTTVGVREPGVNNGKMEMSAFCGTYRAGISHPPLNSSLLSLPPLQIAPPPWIHPFFPSVPFRSHPPLHPFFPSLPFRSHPPLNSSLLSLPPLQIAPAPEFIPSFPPSPSDRTRPFIPSFPPSPSDRTGS